MAPPSVKQLREPFPPRGASTWSAQDVGLLVRRHYSSRSKGSPCGSTRSGTSTRAPVWSSSLPYLVADSVDSYRTDDIDGDTVDAVFDPAELHGGLAFRQSIPSDLMALVRDWTVGFCPLNSISAPSAI